jgi:hypothetical protein
MSDEANLKPISVPGQICREAQTAAPGKKLFGELLPALNLFHLAHGFV